MLNDTQFDFFLQAAKQLSIPLPPDSLLQFKFYFQELIAWNKKVNLTRITELREVFINHFIDSLIPERFMPEGSSVVDIGSGGGFPGIPLKIIRPDLSVTLVDSSLKKNLFQRYLIRTLRLKRIVSLRERAETLANSKGFYEVCIGRAFAPLSRFLPTAVALRASRGIIIAMKGPNFLKELKEVEPQLPHRGISIKHVEKFILPYTKKNRTVIVFG